MLTSSFPAVLVDVAAKPKQLSASQMGQLEKTRQKLGLKKFVKMTHLTCPRHSLTNFEYEAHARTGNGSYVNLLEQLGKKPLKTRFLKS